MVYHLNNGIKKGFLLFEKYVCCTDNIAMDIGLAQKIQI